MTRSDSIPARRLAAGRSSQGGFALFEVLIAVALLAVLAGAAVATLAYTRSRAKEAMCEQDRARLETAVAAYQTRTGYLPSNQGILVPTLLATPSSKWSYEPPFDLRDGEATYVPTPECDL